MVGLSSSQGLTVPRADLHGKVTWLMQNNDCLYEDGIKYFNILCIMRSHFLTIREERQLERVTLGWSSLN